ncbi:MAG: hypothetical protein IT368_02650 [Candidatus Hydrogenedentes bacterium]|nr:hypothetical protein [Candidatus Hydrogenedentota bacterium]
MNLMEQVQRAREERRLVRVMRTPERAHELQGYIVGHGEWILIQNEDGFALNGYSLAPMTQVRRIGFFPARSEYAQACRRLGLHLQAEALPDLDLGNTRSLFSSLRRRGGAVIVESEHEHSDAFLVGQILRVYRSSAVLACVDTTGAWVCPSQMVCYDQITRIGVGDRYCAHFSAPGGIDPDSHCV